MPGELLEGPLLKEPSDQPIAFSVTTSPPGLHVIDRLERREYSVRTPTPVAPVPSDRNQFPVTVDATVKLTTSKVTLPFRESVYIRDASGEPVTHSFDTTTACPRGHYLIDLTTSVKLYLEVEAPILVTHGQDTTTLDFGEPCSIHIGACSPRRHPIGTITTTDELNHLRTAIAHLSSALKKTSPERSYPFHRAHPPLLELGEELSVPDYLSRPDSGVTIEIGQSLNDLLVVAPLAFYLGADLAWGDRRRVTDCGFVRSLNSGPGFETEVKRVLKQIFFLDCLTRTEGDYPVELHERRQFESRQGNRLDFGALYDQSIGERLESYLDLPFETFADLIPSWTASTYIDPHPDSITILPFILDSLSTVHTSGAKPLEGRLVGESRYGGSPSRSTVPTSEPAESGPHLVLPDDDPAMSVAWVGEGHPIGAAKALETGYRNRLGRKPVDRDISIQVVCAEQEMRDELDAVRAVYGSRSDLPFEVDVQTDVSTDRMRELLERDIDFLHYIGHVDDGGFRCRDGWLNAAECAKVGPDVFLLNSCRSHEQGELLVRKGAIAGIVTVTDLMNHRAAAIGRTLAEFLNYGFPLYAALEVVRDTYTFGLAYSLLGNPQLLLAQPTTTIPEYLELLSLDSDSITVVHRTFPSHWAGLGTDICPPYEDGDRHYLLGGEIATVEMSSEELENLLSLPTPLRDGGELRFSIS